MKWADPLAIGLEALAGTVICIWLFVVILFSKNFEKKVIRGSGRELMVPIMVGIFLAFITVFGYISKPTNWSCYISYFAFHISCTLIFAPLLLKSTRIYRIFQAAEKLKQGVKFVDASSMIAFLIVLTLLQVLYILLF